MVVERVLYTCCTSKAVGGLGAAIAAIQPERPLPLLYKGPEQCNRGATLRIYHVKSDS